MTTNHDGAWYDRMYNNRALVPGFATHLQQWAADSALARHQWTCLTDLSYGAGPNETLDIFPAADAKAPVLVFLHGGYWRALDKSDHSFIAPSFVKQGVCVVVPNYALCPAVTVPQIVLQMVKALVWVWRYISEWGGDPARIHVAGHSAGGHLAAMMMACQWQRHAAELPQDLVKSALSVSGLYELASVSRSPMLQSELRLDDAQILRVAHESTARTVTFGATHGDYHAQDGRLNSPHGSIMNIADMKRAMPHDITNALAAAAISIESGLVEPSHVARALSEFDNAPHRIEYVETIDGVQWFNDSKATSPHASAVAIKSFQNIVLIAGGRNKGLDLHELANQPQRVKAVVAIGDDALEIEKAFDGVCRVVRGGSMPEAVRLARTIAVNGDVVLLSPACTSYDWYNNYMERGEDFMQCVRNEAKLNQQQGN